MLTSKQRGALTAQANTLNPQAFVGKQGASPAVLAHLDQELTRHGLVKLRFSDFKGQRRELAESLAKECGAEVVRLIGNVALLYRAKPETGEGVGEHGEKE